MKSKKVPGFLPPLPKTEIDGKINDLSSKTISELEELRQRQLNLLNNKRFLSKLEDKGAKLKAFYNKIITVIQAKQEEEKTCNMLNNLNINSYDCQTINNIEWDGKVLSKQDEVLDSDDDSEPENVMHVLSQTTAQKKIVTILQPEKPLITAEELIKIGDSPHVSYIVNKTEKNHTTQITEKYKPYKTTKSDVHNPLKEINRKKHKKWEVTAATPPPILHGPTKILSLDESLKLQKDYNIHLKEVEARHAAEKLIARTGIKLGEMPGDMSSFGKYRNVETDESVTDTEEGSDKEVHDEEPERGGVVFTVMR